MLCGNGTGRKVPPDRRLRADSIGSMTDRLGRWAPSAATAAMVAFLVAAVLPGATWPLVDGDVWWHIRAGREILATGAISTRDSWSLAGAGREWVSQDWLTNIVLAAGHDLGEWGPTVLSLGFGLLVVASFAALYAAVGGRRPPRPGRVGTTLWLAAGLLVAGPVLGVRPQVLDLACSVAVLWILWRYLADRRRRWLALLPVVSVVWVNVHAGYPLLFLLGGAVVVGEAADRLLRRRPDGEPLTWPEMGWLAAALAASALTLMVNPNGAAMYWYPFYTVGIGSLGEYILEWSRPDFATLPGQLLIAFVAAVVLPTLVLARHRLRGSDALMLVGLTAMPFFGVRFVLVAGPLCAAIAASRLGPVIAASALGSRLASTVSALSARPAGVRAAINAGLCAALVVLGVGIAFARVSPAAQERAITEEMPVAATRWLTSEEPASRVFNQWEWGGYLGLMRPDQPVFIDGRSDVYGDEVVRRYAHTILLEVDPAVELARFEIDHVLFSPDSYLGRWLDASPDWRRAYGDPIAAIWVRR